MSIYPSHLPLALLTAVNLVNYADRYTLSGVLPLLEDEDTSELPHDINDTEGGLLQTVLTISFVLTAPLFSYLADKKYYNRVKLVVGGIFLWSCSVMLGSFSQSYYQLLISRTFVGIGEASIGTLAPSIIADLYEPEKRITSLAIFCLAIPLGSGIGFVIGGEVGSILSWRWAFRITPVVGLLLAGCLLILVKEPKRGLSEGISENVQKLKHSNVFKKCVQSKSPLPESVNCCGKTIDLSLLSSLLCMKSFLLSTAAITMVNFTMGALAVWIPTYIERITDGDNEDSDEEDDDIGRIAIIMGIITFATGIIGTLSGSFLSKKKFYGKFNNASQPFVCSVASLIATPFLLLFLFLVPRMVVLSYVSIVFFNIFIFCCWAPNQAVLLSVVFPHQRPTASSIQGLFSHGLGDAISPIVIGGISDILEANTSFSSGTSLGLSLSFTVLIALLSSLTFFRLCFTLQSDRDFIYQICHNPELCGDLQISDLPPSSERDKLHETNPNIDKTERGDHFRDSLDEKTSSSERVRLLSDPIEYIDPESGETITIEIEEEYPDTFNNNNSPK